MNLSLPLLLLLFTACMTSAAPDDLAVWEFGMIIRCYQPGVNPFKFNNYGCYCGLGGKGTPVDELDQCCQTHDLCYGTAMAADGCTHLYDLPYVLIYHYTCKNKQIDCLPTNSKCQAAVCNCDRAVAECFAKVKYHPANKGLDSKVHCLH